MVVATVSFVFSQKSISSKDIFDEWNRKKAEIEKMNEDPTVKKQLLDQLDSAYVPFFKIVLENEQKTSSTTTNNTSTQNTHQQSIGGSFSLPNFQGKSISITKAADAYAKVKITDAKAEYIRNMSNNSEPNSSSEGYVGIVVNNFPYYMTTVTVVECDDNWKPIESGFNYKFELKPGEKVEYCLFPGKWIITSTAWNSYTTFKSRIKYKDLDPLSFSFYEGKKYYWGSINGFE